jgi:hypothetical protein
MGFFKKKKTAATDTSSANSLVAATGATGAATGASSAAANNNIFVVPAPPPVTGQPIDLNAIATDADANVTLMTNNFNTIFSNIQTMITFYNTELINSKNTQELYDVYLIKNKDLDGNIKEVHNDVLTNDRKTYYEMGALEVLVNWNYFFLYMYFALFFAFILGIVFSENTIPKYQSILLAILLGLYPFIISPIVHTMNTWFIYMRNLYPKNVYNSL